MPTLIPELAVTDIAASRRFWCGVLGFRVLYDRPEDGFAMLKLGDCQLMLDQIDGGALERRGIWDTGRLERPFGRGINLQISCPDYEGTLAGVRAAGIPLHFGPEERWYRRGPEDVGVRQFLVLDPDGYLVRLQQDLGRRPHVASAGTRDGSQVCTQNTPAFINIARCATRFGSLIRNTSTVARPHGVRPTRREPSTRSDQPNDLCAD